MSLLSRRTLGKGAAAGAAVAAFGRPPFAAFAQDATPELPPEARDSGTRADWLAAYEAKAGLTEPETPGGTFIDSATADIQTLQPFLASEQDSLSIAGLVFDTLFGSDPDTGRPVPTGLADSWTLADDRKTYTFHLNPNARWHDGEPVTAEDVKFSFDALGNEETGSVYTGSFVEAVESYRVVDDLTFEMVANEPRFDFLYSLVAFIVPKHIWEDVPLAEWATDPAATGQDPARVIGSGPFKFRSWTAGDRVELVRNDDYYGKVPYLDGYTRIVWPDQSAVINALLNGEVDASALEAPDVATVQGAPGLVVEFYPTTGFAFMSLNLDPRATTVFQDRGVRQALMYALNRQSIVDDILLGYAEVAQGTQPVLSYAYAPDQTHTVYDFDQDKARQLLGEAGWTDGDGDGIVEKDGQPLSFELLYNTGSPTVEQIIAYIQDAWKQVGIDAQPRAVEWTQLLKETTGEGDEPSPFQMAFQGFGWDATFIQDAMFGCSQYRVGFNDMKYCNPDLDAINLQARLDFDEARRRDLLIEASNIVNDDLPVLVLYFSRARTGFSDRLQNFKPNDWGGVPINYWWIRQ